MLKHRLKYFPSFWQITALLTRLRELTTILSFRQPLKTQEKESALSSGPEDDTALEASPSEKMLGTPPSLPPAFVPHSTQSPRFPSYSAHYTALWRCLKADSSVSPEAVELLEALQTQWPNAPPHQILYGEPWEFSEPMIRTNTHRSNDFDAAVQNIVNTGRIIPESEESYLRYLLSYCCGWSATSPQHMEDPCFKYIQWRFRHLGHLHPLLDNAWWSEDVQILPMGVEASLPSHILLATAESYYVYIPEMDTLYNAGNTLKDVFLGLKEGRDKGTPEDGSWEYEELPDIEHNHCRYFPQWYFQSCGFCKKGWDILPFVPPVD